MKKHAIAAALLGTVLCSAAMAQHATEGPWMVRARAVHQDPTNHAGPDIRYPADPTFDKVTFHYGLPQTRAKQAAINFQYAFSDQAQLYAFSVFNHRKVSAGGFFRSLSQYESSEPAAAAVYPAGYLPIENSVIRDDSEVLGLRGKIGDWHYDLSANTGGSHWKLHTTDTFNYSLGAQSPTGFYIGTLYNRQDLFNLDFTKGVDVGLATPLTVAWGLEYRREKFGIKQGDDASYAGAGAQVFPGYQPLDSGDHSRHNRSIYVDLETDFTYKLSAGLAVRNEHYSDFGGTTAWKLSGRYAFTDSVAMRGTASTGFRAPSLQQEYYSSTAINFVQVGDETVPFTIRTFPVNNPAAAALGAQPLRPEKSRNYSVGLVFTPTNGLYTTFDLYQISIDKRIILSGNLVGDAVQDYLTSVGIPFVSGGRFFTNAVDTRTRGADLVTTYPMDLGNSTLKWTGGVNWNKTDIRSIAPQPPQLGLQGLVLPIIDRRGEGFLTDTTPRTKAFVGVDWTAGSWNVHSQLTRYGDWITRSTSGPALDQKYGASYLLDASLGYDVNNWHFSVGGSNLTNKYPDKTIAANSYHGILAYSGVSPYGFNGAYYYARASVDWQ